MQGPVIPEMHRRRFVPCLAASLAMPWAVGAQPAKLPRIGFLEAGAPSANQHFLDAFVRGMAQLGYVDGKNVVFDARWAEGRAERFAPRLSEMMRLDPAVIVVASTLGAVAAKSVVKTIPVVFVGVADPIEAGVVATLARPGGNITGISRAFDASLIGKTLQLLKEVVPAASRIALLWNGQGAVGARVIEAQQALRALGATPVSVEIRDAEDLDKAFATMKQQRADAMMVVTDPLTLRHRRRIVALAETNRLPAVYEFAEFARDGGLIAYSASIPALFERAAVFVDKILRGASPAEMPVEQPTQFALVVNLKTARVLGLTVPPSLLLRADEVIR